MANKNILTAMKQANLWRYQPKLGGFQSLTDFKSLDSININKLILWKVARMEHLAPSPGIAQSTQGTRSGPSRDTNWGENLCVSEGESAQGNTCKVTFTQVEILTGAKRREWMGCWGLLGWLLLVIMDHSHPFPAFSTSKLSRCHILLPEGTVW